MIRGFEGLSFLDYPNALSCVLFLGGCNYDCFYCHNRALLGPGKVIMTKDEFPHFLMKRRGLVDAVVISGGEPTLHPEIRDLCNISKDLEFLVKLDTNGSKPDIVRDLLEANFLDYLALDVKAPPTKYHSITASSADGVFETLNVIKEYQRRNPSFAYEIRTTVAPTLTIEDFKELATLVGDVNRWVLNEYRIPSEYRKEDEGRINEEPLPIGELLGLHPAILTT
ncbi:MAG: anaerobic ribonucleoside-triphosphate reductase activating protein [Sphaerochaeta sp.]